MPALAQLSHASAVLTLTGKQDSLQQIIALFGDCSPKRKEVCWGTSWSTSVTHTFPDMRPGSSLFQPLGTSFPFTPGNTADYRHTLWQPPAYQHRGWNFCHTPPAWPCLAARTVLPSPICQVTCSDHWFLTHLSEKQLDWWNHVNKLDAFWLQEFLGKLGESETHS